MRIRPATVADVSRLLALAGDMHRESRFRDYPFDEVKVGRLLLQLIQSEQGFAWVAEHAEGGVVGGMLAATYESWFSSVVIASDYALYLDPKYRGTLAAARLVQRYRHWAGERGAVCELGCNTGVNPEGYDRFIRGLGFTEAARLYTAGD